MNNVVELSTRGVASARFRSAAEIIIHAQVDLNRILSDGERRDLLKDNTDWPSEDIHVIVAEITERTR